ncbi:hypothetical protein [Trinickia mobilis]|nr:hypothetical protein [Trinickia mobilis]
MANVEICGECAKVRDKVVRHLPKLEAATIPASYGLTDYMDLDGRRR